MKEWFDKETGILKLDEMVQENESYKKIMADGIITDEEVEEQSHKTIELMQTAEKALNDEQKEIVGNLLSELAVLFSVYNYRQLQELFKEGN